MSKKRIYQIAHELDVSSKEVIAAAKKNGIKVAITCQCLMKMKNKRLRRT